MKRYFEIAIIVVVIAVLALLMRNKAGDKPQTPVAWQQDALAVLRPLCGTDDLDLRVTSEQASNNTAAVVVKVRRHPSRPLVAWSGQALGFVRQHYGELGGLNLTVLDWDSGQEIRDSEPRTPQQGYEVENAGRLSNQGQRQLDNVLGPNQTLVLVQCEAAVSPVSGYMRHQLSSRKRARVDDVAERSGPPSAVSGRRPRAPDDPANQAVPRQRPNENRIDGGASADRAVIRRAPQFVVHKMTAFLVLPRQSGEKVDESKLAALVKAAIGLDESRGDQLTVIQLQGGNVVNRKN